MRRFLFHLHSVTGLIAGLGLLIIGLSGSVLVFRQEIESLMMPERVLVTKASPQRLNLDVLVAGWRKNWTATNLSDGVPLILSGETIKSSSSQTQAVNRRCCGSIPAQAPFTERP
jgi:uncharacterized iron-regulated membrane protein